MFYKSTKKYPFAKKPITKQKIQDYAIKYLEKFNTSQGYLSNFLFNKIKTRHNIEDSEELKEQIAEVITNLNNLGYLNDHAFCKGQIKALIKEGNTLFEIKQKLFSKNIDAADIEAAINTIVGENSQEELAFYAALKYAKKRSLLSWQPGISNQEFTKKFNIMLRKGFSSSIAKKVLNCNSLEEYTDIITTTEQIFDL